jgi:hypothetical protein
MLQLGSPFYLSRRECPMMPGPLDHDDAVHVPVPMTVPRDQYALLGAAVPMDCVWPVALGTVVRVTGLPMGRPMARRVLAFFVLARMRCTWIA